jgi:flagellar hook protein FlgE
LSASVQHDGQVIGIGSNGRQVPIGQIAIAAVVNQSGMSAVGQNQFIVTPNSGQLNIGAGTTGGRGQVMAGTLELSNVDLAYEFTRLIVAQRGFSASARHISVTEEMLEEAGNIIR